MKNTFGKQSISSLQELCNTLGYTLVATPLYEQMHQAYGNKAMSAWHRQQKAASARATKAAQTRRMNISATGGRGNRALQAANASQTGPQTPLATKPRRQAKRAQPTQSRPASLAPIPQARRRGSQAAVGARVPH